MGCDSVVAPKTLNVTPLSLGIELSDGAMRTVIPRNTSIPTKVSYKPEKHNHATTKICVFEGEEKIAKCNNLLNEFFFFHISPAREDAKNLDICFEIDENRTLYVSVEQKSIGNKKTITITNHAGGLRVQAYSSSSSSEASITVSEETKNKQVVVQRPSPTSAFSKQNSIGMIATKRSQPKQKLGLNIFEEPYTCHVCSQDETVTKGSHSSHPGHELELKNYEKKYECNGCKELGIGPRYKCVYDQCNYELHKDCFNSKPVFNESSTRSANAFIQEPTDKCQSYCFACGKAIKGFSYRSEEGKILHPCCRKLKKEISLEGVKLRLNEKVLSTCNWCNSKKLRGNCPDTRGCSYVSECKNYQFHVSCTIEMLLEDSLELKNFEPTS